jgi:glucose-1-phosphatase
VIKAFIFDIGNVLLRFDFDLALQRVAAQCARPIIPEDLDVLKNRLEEGQITRHEFLEQLIEAIGFQGEEAELVSAWEDIFEENLLMTDFVRQLHGQFPLYLLSNTSDLHINHVFRQYPVFELFDDAVYSYEAGCMKPSPEIFRVAAAKLRVKPHETIFVDDLEPNVEEALNQGFRAIQYDFTCHDAFLACLAEEGVVV